MRRSQASAVARVVTWLFGGVRYSVHRGRRGAIRGWVVVSAVGPKQAYRSVTLPSNAVQEVLTEVLTTADPGTQADRVESLLALCGASS